MMKKKLWIMVCVAVPLTMVAAIVSTTENRKTAVSGTLVKKNQNKEKRVGGDEMRF